MHPAKPLRAVAEKHQRLRSIVRNLVVVLGFQKEHFILADGTFLAFQPFHDPAPRKHQKSLRGGMVVHVRAVARDEVKHPRAKITGAEKPDIALFRCCHFIEIFTPIAFSSDKLTPILAQLSCSRQATPPSLTVPPRYHMAR